MIEELRFALTSFFFVMRGTTFRSSIGGRGGGGGVNGGGGLLGFIEVVCNEGTVSCGLPFST